MSVKVANFEDLGDFFAGAVGVAASDAAAGAGGGGVNPSGGMVPFFIADGETFTVPEFKQAPFAMNIDNEGILIVDGFLIEVD